MQLTLEAPLPLPMLMHVWLVECHCKFHAALNGGRGGGWGVIQWRVSKKFQIHVTESF